MAVRATPFFLRGPAGSLFAIYYPPATGHPTLGHVLHAPAFAEEMNKSRRMVSLQAAALARQGIGVLIIDLFGTGDSEGDFASARWDLWKNDLWAALGWLQERGVSKVRLWGLRLGCLLALDFAREATDRIEGFVLWQPVTSGRVLMTQFLRLHLAASMMGRGDEQTTAGLRDALARGQSIEVAGYELAPDLVAAIDQLMIASAAPPLRVQWFEVAPSVDRPLLPASQRLVEQWTQAGARVDTLTVVGDQFWATQEISEAPALVTETTRAVAAAVPGASKYESN
jgi:exosortase A-associated hydrolase 2